MEIEGNKIIPADGCKIRRRGAKGRPYGTASLIEGDTPETFEEHTEGEWKQILLDEWKAEEYSRRLKLAIHERYDLDAEIALRNNVDEVTMFGLDDEAEDKAAEYMAYQQYRRECKERVKAELDAITEVPEDEV